MSFPSAYKLSGVAYNKGISDRLYNFTGYNPSGSNDTVILGTGLFVWSGSYTDGCWLPLKREWFNS